MNYPNTQYDPVQFAGGFDVVTPSRNLAPGVCKRASNFECSLTGGYTRIAGYERFDGHSRPSQASVGVMTFAITGAIAVGDTITGMVSGSTAKVIAVSGDRVVVTRQSAAFTLTEGISVSAVEQATFTAFSSDDLSLQDQSIYAALAADEYRTSISEVPGEGRVLGVCEYKGLIYAWRNIVGSTSAKMFKTSASGWVEIALGRQLSFTNASVNVAEGQTLTQGGASGVIAKLILESGTLLSGTNTGRIIFATVTSVFAAGAATTSGGSLTVSGADTVITLLPDGHYETVVSNFAAGQDSAKMYGCDGVNNAFEFDGTTFAPIVTGMPTDAPNHITVHKQHLFLSFGYSLQFSSLGEPFVWSPITGAGEIGMNDDISNLIILPGDQTSGALAVTTRSETSILYGTSSANFALTTFNSGSGAISGSAQNLEQTYYLNDFGVTSLSTTKDFGNFLTASLTLNISPFIRPRIPLATVSGLNRSKGQYRVFFSDGSGLYITTNSGRYLGSMPVQYTHPVSCICEGTDTIGNKTSYFGSDNGFVYEMDVGTSFDGEDIYFNLGMVFSGAKRNELLKFYRRANLEVTGSSYVEFQFGYELGYKSLEYSQGETYQYATEIQSSFWDAFIWDAFIWDGSDIAPKMMDLTGTAENISLIFAGNSDAINPFTINSATIHYTPRRGLR